MLTSVYSQEIVSPAMLTYKPQIESRTTIGRPSPMSFSGYHSLMTRQSLFALLHQLPHRNVILPRFVPAGVYEPVRETQKKIFYYDVPNTLLIDTAFVRSLALDPSDTIFYHIHQDRSFSCLFLLKHARSRA